MPRGKTVELQLPRELEESGSDDSGFMAAVAQQVQTTWEKKRQESETRFLKTAKLELEGCGSERVTEYGDIVTEMNTLFESFVTEYAENEDRIRATWSELLSVVDECLAQDTAKRTQSAEADKAREKGMVRGMAGAKRAVEDAGELIASLR